MYTNNKDINTNELVVVHYGNTVTIKGSQIIVNGQPGPELPYKVNDLLIRQATSVLIGVEGKHFYHRKSRTSLHSIRIKDRISPSISMVFVFTPVWVHPSSIKHVVYAVPTIT